MDIMKGLSPPSKVYFIGIKGTGMCALAEFLHNRRVKVTGSDCADVFYTDAILNELNIPFFESFDAKNIINEKPDVVIHSDAYSFDKNPEMAQAKKQGLPIFQYSKALGEYTRDFDFSGITGSHGKTTTTAMSGTMIRAAGLPAQVLVGSAVSSFGNRSTLNLGDKYFIAETDEYRRHFLNFEPQRIILSSVEEDHQDYFPDYDSILKAYLEYLDKLPDSGQLIYCADDLGACEAANIISEQNKSLTLIPYGFTAQGDWGIVSHESGIGFQKFNVRGFSEEIEISIPGKHSCVNAAAALALTNELVLKEFGSFTQDMKKNVCKAIKDFRGSKRRSEVLGEARGILFMDDYGHHPTEIATTLRGLKEFYGRRLVLSFMSHTYTRTAALFDEFASSLEYADILVLHKIYGSAREVYTGGITGLSLYEKVKTKMGEAVFYSEEVLDAVHTLKDILKPGDLFITMGAGDNFKLGQKLFEIYNGMREKNVSASGNFD